MWPGTPRPPPPAVCSRLLRTRSVGGAHRTCVRAAVMPPALATRAVMAVAMLMTPPAATEHVLGAREHHEAVFLSLIEARVERRRSVGEHLARSAPAFHRARARRHPLDRALRLVGAGARRQPLRAHLGEIAQRGLDRRPILLLVGFELEPRKQRGAAGIGARA